MPTQNPHDPKSGQGKDEGARHDQGRQDRSRQGHGPDNPLPGEPGGPSTGGHVDPSESADKGPNKGPNKDDRAR